MQKDYEPLAFQPPFIPGLGREEMRANEGLEDFLLGVGEDKFVHWVGAPVDGLELVNEEAAPYLSVEGVADCEGGAQFRVCVVFF